MAIVTLQEVRAYLNMAESFSLKMTIDAINELIPDLCGRVFDVTDYTEKLFLKFPNLVLKLSHFPVVSLTTLTNEAGTSVTPLESDLPRGLLQLELDYWNTVTSDATVPTDIFDAAYPAGFDPMPSMLKIAAMAIIQDRMEMDDTSFTKQKLSDRTFERKGPLPPLAAEIIERYTVVI